MARVPLFRPGTGLLLLIVGILAMVLKSGLNSAWEALLVACFLLTLAAYLGQLALEGETNWWLILPAGLSFSLMIIVLVHYFRLVPPGLLWVIFFCGAGLTLYLLWKYRPYPARDGWLRGGAILMAALAVFQWTKTLHRFDTLTVAAVLLVAGGLWLLLHKR